jgi:hypothetical protein
MRNPKLKKWFTVKELSILARCSRQYIHELILKGKIYPDIMNPYSFLFSRDNVIEIIHKFFSKKILSYEKEKAKSSL